MKALHIQKTIDWGVKIASLAITGPATWIVAGNLFSDIQSPILLFIMQFAALLLVEGVLFSNWLLLEFDDRAPIEVQVRYALTAMGMYILLAIIGWQHEGPLGLVFRAALLFALLGSGWDKFVYVWQKASARIDRTGVKADRVVARAQRKSARRLALRENALLTDAQLRLMQAKISNDEKLQGLIIEHQHVLALTGEALEFEKASTNTNHRYKLEAINTDTSYAAAVVEKTGGQVLEESVQRAILRGWLDGTPKDSLAKTLGYSSKARLYDVLPELASGGLMEKRGASWAVTEQGKQFVEVGKE